MAFENPAPPTVGEDGRWSPPEPTDAMEFTPSVSVIICAYTLDRLSDVLEAIRSIEQQDAPPSEIIVVVDHNPQLLIAIGDAVQGEIVLLQNRFNRGLSGLRNTGIAQATGDPRGVFVDDAVADPGCLRRLSAPCVEPKVIGAGALIEPVWPGSRPSRVPAEFLWVVRLFLRWTRARKRQRVLLGAAMCLRRDVFVRAGGSRWSARQKACQSAFWLRGDGAVHPARLAPTLPTAISFSNPSARAAVQGVAA